MQKKKNKAPRNKTIVLTKEDKLRLHSNIIKLSKPAVLNKVLYKTINNDIFDVIDFLPENTEHPTQKPEKLIAKLILASSNEGDVVFDPFLGSGTTSVVAKKLGRKFFGVELDETFSLTTEKRLELADTKKSIQGYYEDSFQPRNTLKTRKNINHE